MMIVFGLELTFPTGKPTAVYQISALRYIPGKFSKVENLESVIADEGVRMPGLQKWLFLFQSHVLHSRSLITAILDLLQVRIKNNIGKKIFFFFFAKSQDKSPSSFTVNRSVNLFLSKLNSLTRSLVLVKQTRICFYLVYSAKIALSQD